MTVGLAPWLGFVGFIVAMLMLDLFVLHRKAHEVSLREAASWSVIWVALGLPFGAVVWLWQGGTAAGEYLAGYLIEKTLSVDNIFVFAMLFAYFAVPLEFQHRLLFWVRGAEKGITGPICSIVVRSPSRCARIVSSLLLCPGG